MVPTAEVILMASHELKRLAPLSCGSWSATVAGGWSLRSWM